jgi:hypothetical protein
MYTRQKDKMYLPIGQKHNHIGTFGICYNLPLLAFQPSQGATKRTPAASPD